MVDIAAYAEAFKAGFDALRAAISLIKDIKSGLPEGEKKDVLTRTLLEACTSRRRRSAQ